MFDSLTYKKKNILLLVGVIIFTILAYSLSVSETIQLIGKNKELEVKLSKSETAAVQIAQLKQDLLLIDNNLGNTEDYKDFQQILLERVSEFCDNSEINLIKFPKPFTGKNENYLLQTFYFEVEGSYFDALKLTYLLEEEWKLGRTVSAAFEKRINRRTKKNKLYMTLYIQSIKTI